MAGWLSKRDAANKTDAKKTNVAAAIILDPTLGSKPNEAKNKTPLKTAGAMQRGSAEAYTTIVQAFMNKKDPLIAATEKQTHEIVAELKRIVEGKPKKLLFAPE